MNEDKNSKKYNLLMLIDDNAFDLKINARIVMYADLFERILTFSSSVQALEYLKENQNNRDDLPRLILLDIQMPEMNGFEFMEHYAQLSELLHNSCTVSMLSSTDDYDDIQWVEKNKYITSLIKKPLTPFILRRLMEEER